MYLLLEGVFVVDQVDVVEHGLVVDRGKAGDDLHEQVEMRVSLGIVHWQQFKDIPVEIKGIF